MKYIQFGLILFILSYHLLKVDSTKTNIGTDLNLLTNKSSEQQLIQKQNFSINWTLNQKTLSIVII